MQTETLSRKQDFGNNSNEAKSMRGKKCEKMQRRAKIKLKIVIRS